MSKFTDWFKNLFHKSTQVNTQPATTPPVVLPQAPVAPTPVVTAPTTVDRPYTPPPVTTPTVAPTVTVAPVAYVIPTPVTPVAPPVVAPVVTPVAKSSTYAYNNNLNLNDNYGNWVYCGSPLKNTEGGPAGCPIKNPNGDEKVTVGFYGRTLDQVKQAINDWLTAVQKPAGSYPLASWSTRQDPTGDNITQNFAALSYPANWVYLVYADPNRPIVIFPENRLLADTIRNAFGNTMMSDNSTQRYRDSLGVVYDATWDGYSDIVGDTWFLHRHDGVSVPIYLPFGGSNKHNG